MPQPDFTAEEKYLLDHAKLNSYLSYRSRNWKSLVATSVMAVLSVYMDSIPFLLSAFVLLAGFQIYEELIWRRADEKWQPVWRSIIAKFEEACGSANLASAGPTESPNMITCSDCDHRISRRALACPNCGCPTGLTN